MRKRFLAIALALTMPFSLSACSDANDDVDPEQPPLQEEQPVSSENDGPAELEDKEISQYEDIEVLFSSIIPDAELRTSLKNGNRIHTKIITNLSSETAPEGWADILADFDAALSASHEAALTYSATTSSCEILAGDETILASGFNASVQFDKFEEKVQEKDINPPTISKFEYDQIAVGMTLSKVREIVGGDGRLESSIGTAGVTSTIQTYRFLGEKEGSYADILFDDYEVYSKHEFRLE